MRVEPALNEAYRNVINSSDRVRHCTKIGLPPPLLQKEHEGLQRSVTAVFEAVEGAELPDEVRARALLVGPRIGDH
jgi:DNA-directed RNA polymerase beta' subunit